jgi:hypothetical protein
MSIAANERKILFAVTVEFMKTSLEKGRGVVGGA